MCVCLCEIKRVEVVVNFAEAVDPVSMGIVAKLPGVVTLVLLEDLREAGSLQILEYV